MSKSWPTWLTRYVCQNLKSVTLECVGPEEISLKDIINRLLKLIGKKRLLFPMPISIAATMGFFMQYLPSPIITYDQVKLLRQDNVVSEKQNTLESLDIVKHSVKDILQNYI